MKRRTKKWYVEYRDQDGILQRVPGYTDKSATMQLATDLESGRRHPLRDRRPISEHLEDYRKFLAAKGNTDKTRTCRTQSRESVMTGLERVRERARKKKQERFTALLHHIDIERLKAAFSRLKRDAAPGIDGVTWGEYEQDLELRLVELHGRIHRGAYRALPTRRKFIPKGDGQRPLGVAALEDKIVQRAVVEVLNAIYETDFLGFSYGFRPGRNQHQALDALAVGILRKKVNWVLDADIRAYFDTIPHDRILRVLVSSLLAPTRIDMLASCCHSDTWRRRRAATRDCSGSVPTLRPGAFPP